MRKFAGFLAAFGLALGLLVGAALLYLHGQIPPVAFSTPAFTLRADSGVATAEPRRDLETATTRFTRLLGPRPGGRALTVAYIDEPKRMNSVMLYVALRRAFGSSVERLPLPFPTPRLAKILTREPLATADEAPGGRGLGHEVGHWLLSAYLKGPANTDTGGSPGSGSLPVWMREGIAGYCEADESRMASLLRVRKALLDTARGGVLDLNRLLGQEPPRVSVGEDPPGQHTAVAAAGDGFEIYYDETLLLVSYLEARHPGLVAKIVRRPGLLDRSLEASVLKDRDAFMEWIASVSPLSI